MGYSFVDRLYWYLQQSSFKQRPALAVPAVLLQLHVSNPARETKLHVILEMLAFCPSTEVRAAAGREQEAG